MSITFNDAVRAVQKWGGSKQNKIEWQTAVLGDGHGNVSAGSNMVFCRLSSNSSVIEVLNLHVAPVDGLRVRIAKTPEMPLVWQVVGQDDQRLDEGGGPGGGTIYNTPLHAPTHGYLGIDQVNIDWRQITNLRVYAISGFTVGVMPGLLPRSGADLVVPAQTIDLTSHIPGSGLYRYVLISIDSTGAIAVTNGATQTGLMGLTLADIPDTPAGNFRLAAIRLYDGQAAINENTSSNDMRDLRWPQERLAGVMNFIELGDVPHSYTGAGGLLASVKADESGLEFIPNVPSGGSGFSNPMTTLGDMIYEGEGSGINEAYAYDHSSDPLPPQHAFATASSTYDPAYAPPDYVLQTFKDADLWASVGWSSSIQVQPGDPLWIKIDLGSSIEIAGWRLKHKTTDPSIGTNGFGVAGEYTVESSPDNSSWNLEATQTVVDMDEAVNFGSPVTARYFRFTKTLEWAVGHPPDVPADQWQWTINDIRLYATSGLTPVRLPIGSMGEVLTVVDDGGGNPVPDWRPNTVGMWYNVLNYGADGTLTNDDAAVAAIKAAMPATGGVIYFPTIFAGMQWPLSPTLLDMSIGIRGDGGLSIDLGTNTARTQITCASSNAPLFTVTSFGCSFADVQLINTSGSTPTAGSAAISVTAGGTMMTFERCSFVGFYINVDMQDGWGYKFDTCWFWDSIKYELKMQHTDQPDAGDQSLVSCIFSPTNHGPDAAIRWESGGGLKMTNCKINGTGILAQQYTTGIDCHFDSIQTSVLLISNCSLENVSGDMIKVTTSGTTPRMALINIVGNEIALGANSGGHAINIAAANLGEIFQVIIDANTFKAWSAGPAEAISLTNIDNVFIGTYTVSTNWTGFLTQSGCTNVKQIGLGTGDVVGPSGAVDDDIAVFDGTTGKLIKDGGRTIASILVIRHEVLMASGITPPDPLISSDGTDWLYSS